MIERIMLLVVMSLLGYVVFRAYQAWQMKRISETPDDPILRDLRVNVPTIVYFTTPQCMPCKTIQQPALETLRLEMGESLQIIQIDASEAPDVATRWGVMSAPTTFVLDGKRQARRINHGAVTAETLKEQLALLSA